MKYYEMIENEWVEVFDLVTGKTYKTVYDGGWYIITIHNPPSEA